MHYYQFNIGDYASSTQHLDDSEDLAYRRMLDIYYSKESALTEDQNQIARLIRMRTHSDSIATVLNEFFVLKKDGYHCARADKEIKAFKAKSDSAKRSAQARWSKNKDIEPCERIPNAKQTQCDGNAKHKPLNIKQETLNKKQVIKDPSRFAEFWDLYAKKTDSKKCEDKFNKLTQVEIDLIFDKLPAYIRSTPDKQFRKNPITWLNGKCWNDEIQLPTNEKPTHDFSNQNYQSGNF